MAIEIMPRVAIQPVRSQTGGVEGRVVPMQDQTGATLRAVGEGAQDLGQATTAAADTFQDQIDIAQSLRMRNLYDADVEAELMDPERGFLTTVGMDANGERRKQSFDRLKMQREKIMALAKNDVQRLNFAEHADGLDARSRKIADDHQSTQVKNFRAGETKTSAEIGIRRAIQLVGTDEGEIAKMGALRDLDSLADIYGWPKDSKLREKMKQDHVDALHAGVIDQWTQDPMKAPQAAAYIAKNRGEMSEKSVAHASGRVRAVTIGNESAMAVGVAMAESLEAKSAEMAKQGRSTPSEFDTLSMFDDAERRIGAREMPQEVRDAAIDRLRGERANMLRQNAQRAVSALNDAATWLTETDGRTIASMQQDRPDLYAALADSDEMGKLRTFEANRKQQVTGYKAYAEAWAQTDEQLRGQSAEEVARRFWGSIDEGDMNSLMARWRVANGKGSDKDRKVLSAEDRIQEAFFSASSPFGITRGALDDAGKRRLYRFKTDVQKELDGRGDLSDAEFQKVLDSVAMNPGFIADAFGDTEVKSVSTLLPEEEDMFYVRSGGDNIYATQLGRTDRTSVPSVGAEVGDRIAPSEREIIISELVAAGLPATEQAIADQWTRRMSKRRATGAEPPRKRAGRETTTEDRMRFMHR